MGQYVRRLRITAECDVSGIQNEEVMELLAMIPRDRLLEFSWRDDCPGPGFGMSQENLMLLLTSHNTLQKVHIPGIFYEPATVELAGTD